MSRQTTNQRFHQLQQLETQSAGNVEAAQKLARQIDHELVDLIDYLRRALAYLQANEELLHLGGESEGEFAGKRRTRLQNLISRTEQLRDSLVGRAEQYAGNWASSVQNLWQEAKHTVSGAFGRKKPSGGGSSSVWRDLFRSRDWAEFFNRHPALDPDEWKGYLRENVGDPHEWRDFIEDRLRQTPHFRPLTEFGMIKDDFDEGPFEYSVAKKPKYSTISGGGFEFGGPAIQSTRYRRMHELASQMPVSMTYCTFSLLYFTVLMFRLWQARKFARIYVGDGVLELVSHPSFASVQQEQQQRSEGERPQQPNLANFKDAVETSALWSPVANLRRNLLAYRAFIDTIVLPLLVLALMEMRGVKSRYLHTFHLSIIVPLVYMIEKQVRQRGTFQIYSFTLAVAGSLGALGLLSAASLLEYW